tara:strand:+ start:1252 stop:1956 length:705 start_codon:yes stop_codon:yes gene_type:complete
MLVEYEHEDEDQIIERERLHALEIYQDLFSEYIETPGIAQLGETYQYFNEIFQKFDLYTTRFNSFTYQQNRRYKENMGFYGSIYSTTLPFPPSAPTDKYIFIIDMNNTTNQIMGFGFLKNKLAAKQKLWIYDEPSFNNCVYKSNFYIPISEIDNPKWSAFIENEFEKCLFYGKAHQKRGGSFSRFPIKKLKYKHLKFMLTLFVIINPSHFRRIPDLGLDLDLTQDFDSPCHDSL